MIFSPVYSRHEDGSFIDSDSSILNVAVSGAKDSFLVFGDMDLFEIQPASSPTWQKLEETGFLASMLQARARGIEVTIVTDKGYNTSDKDYAKRQEKKQNLAAALGQLNAVGIATRLVDRMHSKIVMGDDGLLCVGSFNWFSATREAKYEKYDTSMVYYGGNLKREIEAIQSSLDKRQV